MIYENNLLHLQTALLVFPVNERLVSDINESQDIFKSKVNEWFYEIDPNDLYTCKIISRLYSYTTVFQ